VPLRPRSTIGVGALALGACFPAVAHGPRIEPGLAAGLTASVSAGPRHTEGDEGGIRLRQGVIGVYGGQGWAARRPTAPSAYVGVAIPVFFPLTQVDLFVEAPRAWLPAHGAAGLGVVLDVEGFSAYGQAGRITDAGNGWFLTGGYGRRSSWARHETASPAWFGGAAVQLANRWSRTRLFVQGATGRDPGPCSTAPGIAGCVDGRRTTALAAGVSLGWQQRK
jgi:hypothetical protein